jgi:enoyl-[acyl-carrier-protein] reductase (NADH)
VPVLRCDVTKDDDIDALFAAVAAEWGALDGLLHAIAFAPREALTGDFLNGMSRAAFATAHDVSSYSLAALAKGARALMQGRRGALVTLTYLGALRALPNYNVMGLAKASLEANVRYLAATLGPEAIRVNGIPAGPIKTLAAAGIGGSPDPAIRGKIAPLRRSADRWRQRRGILLSDLGRRHGDHLSCGIRSPGNAVTTAAKPKPEGPVRASCEVADSARRVCGRASDAVN